MLKLIATLMIVLLFIPFSLSAQLNDKYLVAVDLDQDINFEMLEKLQLSIYHIFEDVVIASVSAENVKNLTHSNIQFKVIDEYPHSQKYYIVSSKKGERNKQAIKSQILYDEGEAFLIKTDRLDVKNLMSNGFEFASMKIHRGNFSDDKQIIQYKILTPLDSIISDVLVEINVDSVEHYIQSLQDFETRFLLADTRDSVAAWIQDQFEKMGYTDVILDEFWNEATGTWQKNVVATIPGTKDTESIYVVGGHHDSYSSGDPFSFAPGADDNASGTTAVLEIARAIMESGYQPEATFKFITFAAEEYGLYGSFDFAEQAYNSGMNIKLMINHDMISHTLSPVSNSNIDINFYSGWEDFRDLAQNNTEKYTLINPIDGWQNSSGSDSYPFWVYGFPAVYFEEHDFSPYYHSPSDVIENYSIEFCTEVIKASCATLISASVIPSKIENFNIVDMGDGNSLLLNWSPNIESDISGYHIYLGTSAGIYDTVFTSTDTSLLIDNLTDESTYYIGIASFDLDMFESIIVEKTAVPRSVPLGPSSVQAQAMWHAVELTWTPNLEFDIAGYNIYRSSDLAEPFVQINESMIPDTSFIDNSLENAIYYYYVIRAVDQSQIEGMDSDPVKSRGVFLDQGILVVDETLDDIGEILRPTDAEVDVFYSSVLERFKRDDFDLAEHGGVDLADLGAYSTIIWHGNDNVDLSVSPAVKKELQKYLEFGGNLLYTGYLPSKAFEGNIVYTADYSSGDFIYDYLKIQHVERTFGSRFNGATPLIGDYPEIYTDSSKTSANTNFHLRNIEAIEAAPGGATIYLYNTIYDTSTVQGSMKDQPVGVAYFGDDHQAVTLSFPLYYMQEEQTKDLFHYILKDQFNEVMVIEEKEDYTPIEFSLMQNYPNPFNPTTVITWKLAVAGHVDLSVFNILGEKVATLISGYQKSGIHQVEWNASGIASGVYFYRLQAVNFRDVKKMVIIK